MSASDTSVSEDSLSFVELVRTVWARKFLVAGLAVAGAVIGAGWSFLITPEYQAQLVAMPSSGENSGGALGEIADQLGGLGNLVAPGLANASQREEYIQFLRSRNIAERFIKMNNLMPVLFSKRWDAAGKRWKDDGKPPPTMGQAYRVFNERIRLVTDDRRTRLVTLTMRWQDRELSAAWANGLLALVNDELRTRAIAEASRNIDYLNTELKRTQQVELQQTIYRIVESQMRTMMMAKGREEYAFKVIDPAVVPDPRDRIRPQRMAMVAIGLVLGATSAILMLMLQLMRGPAGSKRPD